MIFCAMSRWQPHSPSLATGVLRTPYGVDGDHGAFDRHHVQERRNGDDLVGFLRHLDLPEHETLARGEGRDHVDRRLGALLLVRAARRLAVDGDDVGGRLGQRRHPGNEAALERLRVERGEDIAELVMRGRAVLEGPEAAQEVDLRLAKERNFGERLGAGENGEQAQQQDFIERINHFALLPAIRHVLEILQKNRGLGQRRDPCPAHFHRNPPSRESEDFDRFSTSSCCHALFRPIALVAEPIVCGRCISRRGSRAGLKEQR